VTNVIYETIFGTTRGCRELLSRPNEALEAIVMMDTVLFTDHDIVIFAITSSAIALLLAVLAVSARVEQRIGRIESRIRQAMWSDVIHQ
jgi:hypothetical protein